MLGGGIVFAFRVTSKACGANLEILSRTQTVLNEEAELTLWGQELSRFLNHQRGSRQGLSSTMQTAEQPHSEFSHQVFVPKHLLIP